MTLEEFKVATKQDKTLQCVSWLVRSQSWNQIDNLPTEHQDAELKVVMFALVGFKFGVLG